MPVAQRNSKSIIRITIIPYYEGVSFQKGQVDVSLNDRLVSNSNYTYPYRSYIETLLNYVYDRKTSQLTSDMFYNDNDDGLEKRKQSATVDMIGGLHSGPFHQERLLLNLVDVKIKWIRSKPEFSLQGDEG
ncbi:hypothetical protein HNY73_003330 [Argiope bruennichi]|uniref:Uncharacterized protein n=1 Tax=Argiope bruennichi TaxID=94029 RepID=A0A8T0FXQ8_ARGBR|nr:hypothetical protein HNY73_003330 [Argiope bruennichi]